MLCEWERKDSPTRNMTADQMRDYYKRVSALHDVRFYLKVCQDMPTKLRRQFEALADRLEGRRNQKPRPDDRDDLSRLKTAYRVHVYTRWKRSLPKPRKMRRPRAA